MPKIVAPATASPGQNVKLVGSGFDEAVKFRLTTVDPAGTESGFYPDGHPSNENRPAPDGSFVVGIRVPPGTGNSTIRVYQGGVVVASATVRVGSTALPFAAPRKLPTGDTT